MDCVRPIVAACALLLCAAVACTDWNAAGGATGPSVGGGYDPATRAAPGQGSATAGGGPVPYETWQAPAADAAAFADAARGADAGSAGQPDAGSPVDAAGQEAFADAGGSADGQPAEVVVIGPDAGDDLGASDGAAAPDAALDTPVADSSPADAAKPDAAVADLPPYSFDGKADFVGWPELPAQPELPVQPDVPTPPDAGDDAFATDDAGADGLDSQSSETAAADSDAQNADGATEPDNGTEPDAAPELPPADLPLMDVSLQDTADSSDGGTDVSLDAGFSDSAGETATDSASSDGGVITDVGLIDAADGGTDVADTGLPDGIVVPDWQGYPAELPFAADADIYGGPIASCLSLYLYQNESCGDAHPTADCINTIAKDGSLYSQFLFAPLQQCETAVCTSLCAAATDKSCMEGCVGKYCTAQFLACTSNAAYGADDCASTFKCSQQYPNKLLTISAKCYANASKDAQKQFSATISCTGQPQTQSCVQQVAACYGNAGGGTDSCSTTATCAQACAGDQNCAFACFGKANPQALTLLDAVLTCQLQKCKAKCDGSPDPKCGDTCMQNECKNELVQCLVN